jgi:hypothetical protein
MSDLKQVAICQLDVLQIFSGIDVSAAIKSGSIQPFPQLCVE